MSASEVDPDQQPWQPLSVLGLPPTMDLSWLPPGAGLGRVLAVRGPSAQVSWCHAGADRTVTELVELRTELALRPVAGDWVAVAASDVVQIGPRTTSLTRPDPNGRDVQVLAANIDLALIAVPLDRDPHPTVIERLTVMAWESGATPLIVLTKLDLAAAPEQAIAEAAQVAPGVDVIATSVVDGSGLPELRARLGVGITATLVGASGAGKTSLLNALDGHAEAVGTVRRDGQGRHTTTTRRLFPLTSGGVLLDLPGIRRLEVLAGADAVEATFADIAELAARCRFANCGHQGDAGCAVQEAVDLGELPARRVDSWHRLQRELAHLQRRNDPRAAAAERAKWAQISKEQRRYAKLCGRG